MKRIAAVAALSLATALVMNAAHAAPAGAVSSLTAVSGQGTGTVKVSPTSEDQGTFHVQGEVNIHAALPNTAFSVQRAIDFDAGDGNCEGPGMPPPNGWVELARFTTSSAGAGAAHFERATPLESGSRFDVIIRVVSDDRTQLLLSECMTVTVK